jgi:hypothetical protein
VVVGAHQEDSSTTGVNSTPDESASGSGAAYVFTRSGTTWTEQAYLKPAAVGTTQEFDNFGRSVAVSGDTVVVGANGESSSTTGVNSTPDESASGSGAAYVFTRSGTTWTEQAYLKPAAVGTTQAGDLFGFWVAVSGDTVAVGALGESSSTTGVNSTPDESASGSGAAYVFTRSGTTWTQQAYLKPAAVGTSQASDNFGISVAVSGDTVVVGAHQEDSSTTGVNSTPDESASASGAAYVFIGATAGPLPDSVVSRKGHGTPPVDRDIDLPLSGCPGIECRTGGATDDYQVVFEFPTSVTVNGDSPPQADVTSGTGDVGTGGTPNGGVVAGSGTAVITVPLTNVANEQTIVVTLFDVDDGTNPVGNVSVVMAVLEADTNETRDVDVGDTNQTRSRSGQLTSDLNKRSDVNLDGRINVGDVNFVRSRSGDDVGPCP